MQNASIPEPPGFAKLSKGGRLPRIDPFIQHLLALLATVTTAREVVAVSKPAG